MGLLNFISGQFIEVIEWLDNTNDTLVYRFDRASNNEIKQGAKLIVRPGQVAVFVNEGHLADIFETGTFELYTRNLPILSKLKAWPYGFNSPFKAEVYFFSLRNFTNLKWGTANPITLRDPEFGPVRVRAFGTYAMQIMDPKRMLEQLVSTDGLFQVDEISYQVRNMIVSAFATWLGRGGIPVLDLAARYHELGDTVRQAIQPSLDDYGLRLTQLLIENISLPPEVEKVLDKRTSMGILGNMQEYTQFQAANAIETAASQPGGGNQAMNFGVGMAMGQQLVNSFQPPASPGTPPPPPVGSVPPPPAPQAIPEWHFSKGGQTLGPMTIPQMIQQGLTADTFVWKSGMANWAPATTIPEVASQLPTIEWYVSQNGQRLGPMQTSQLRQQGLTPDTHIWRDGFSEWKRAADVPELASLLQTGSMPPPPPAA